MILDANDLAPGASLDAELCIIGAGAAGIATALQFVDAGYPVLVLESGGLKADKPTQDLYAGTVADERLHSPPDRYRQRRFGGSTTIWGGRCMPFDPIDFEARDYVPHSGWPIGPDALAPFYPEANRLCEAGRFAYTIAEAFPEAPPALIDGFSSPNFTTDTLERFSRPTDFGSRYRERLAAAPNVRVVLHANVTAIRLAQVGSRVDHLDVATLGGRKLTVRARRYVLATGGLEVARLLLASNDVQRDGIGNRFDTVGRYYMCHLAGTIGAIRIRRSLDAVHHGYDRDADGIYCRRRFALVPATQRSNRIGNFIARLHHPRITDPAHRSAVLSLLFMSRLVIPYEYAKRLHGEHRATLEEWGRHVINVASGPHEAVGFAWHMLRDRRLAERKFPSVIIKSKANLYSLDFHAEQQPNPSSRVQLGTERDPLGMARLRVDWRYTEGDVDTVRRALALLADDLRRCGVGAFDYDPSQVEAEMTRYGAYGGHHIGTARMGSDRRSSVVDADARVHDVDNLYVASAAVFPTSSQANPTLTIVALALRLAAHLKATQARDEVDAALA